MAIAHLFKSHDKDLGGGFTVRRILPAAAFLKGEYGVKGTYVGVPIVLGAGGVEKVVEISLSGSEQKQFDKSVAAVAGLIEAQLSNDPGGNRWTQHLDRMVDLLVDDADKRKR